MKYSCVSTPKKPCGQQHEIVGTAVSADAAIERVGTLKPDLVLMDIKLLGHKDGVEAAIEIRRRFDIPSLFTSAFNDPLTQSRAAAAAPIGFVNKPYRGDSLVQAIKRLMPQK
jgi:CheY-like chemotaxis protein